MRSVNSVSHLTQCFSSRKHKKKRIAHWHPGFRIEPNIEYYIFKHQLSKLLTVELFKQWKPCLTKAMQRELEKCWKKIHWHTWRTTDWYFAFLKFDDLHLCFLLSHIFKLLKNTELLFRNDAKFWLQISLVAGTIFNIFSMFLCCFAFNVSINDYKTSRKALFLPLVHFSTFVRPWTLGAEHENLKTTGAMKDTHTTAHNVKAIYCITLLWKKLLVDFSFVIYFPFCFQESSLSNHWNKMVALSIHVFHMLVKHFAFDEMNTSKTDNM